MYIAYFIKNSKQQDIHKKNKMLDALVDKKSSTQYVADKNF